MLAHTVTLMHVPLTLPTMHVGAPELELAEVADDELAVEDELTVELEELEVDDGPVDVVVVVDELEAADELEFAFAPLLDGPLLDGPVVISEPVLPPAPPAATTLLPPRPSVVVVVTAPPIAVDVDERPPRPSDPETRPGP
jgi:hypothetical protein